jgi:hypothetical protein
MSDDFDENDVEMAVRAALEELLNIAASVADLQITDEAAEEIFAVCNLVAEYYQIERARAVTVEHEDGSFTTHFESFVGSDEDFKSTSKNNANTVPIPGSIRTHGKPKLRLIDCDTLADRKPKAPPQD